MQSDATEVLVSVRPSLAQLTPLHAQKLGAYGRVTANPCAWHVVRVAQAQPANPCALSSHREVILGHVAVLSQTIWFIWTEKEGAVMRRGGGDPIPTQASQKAKACSKQLASELYSTRCPLVVVESIWYNSS